MKNKSIWILILVLVFTLACGANYISDRLLELEGETNKLKAAISTAKQEMRRIDYDYLAKEVAVLEKTIWRSKELLKTKDNEDEATLLLVDITSKLKDLRPFLYESLPVETRAMWVDRVTVESFFNRDDIKRHLDLLQSININLIFIDVYNNGTSIYPSEVATYLRRIELMYDGDDLLSDFISEAHKRDMEVHPLVRIFGLHNGAEYFTNDRFHWFDKTKDNSYTLSNGFYWLNPVHPEVREYMITLLKELTQNYDIDGIHLDYIRYDTNFGYSQYTRDLFKSLFGVDPLNISSPEMENTFTVFKTQFINKFVERTYTELKAIKPDLLLSAAVSAPYTWIKLDVGQDWVNWAKNRIIHFVTPMAYRTTAREYSAVINSDIDATSGSTYLYPGLGIYLLTDGISALEQLKAAQDASVPGQALYSTTNMKQVQYKMLQEGPWSKPATPTYRDPQNSAHLILEDLAKRIDEFQSISNIDPSVASEYVHLINNLSGKVASSDLRQWDNRDLRLSSEQETILLEQLLDELARLKKQVNKDSEDLKKLPDATSKRIIRDLKQVENLLMPLYFTSKPFVYTSTTLL